VILIMILDFTPTPAQIDSMIQICASLTGFPASSISLVITQQRDSTVQATLTGNNAGAAGNTISSTLISNPSYLQQQDASLGGVRSVQVQDNSSSQSGGLSTGAIVGIAVGAAVAVALVVVLVALLIRRRVGQSQRREIEMAANHAYQ
jgi:hypothetical protein